VRFTGPTTQLFIDGALVDEEYPIGAMRSNDAPFLIGAALRDGQLVSGLKGQIDHVALWDRALTDEEVTALSGGEERAQISDRAYNGPLNPVTLQWRPRGYNKKVGDAFPFFHDGTLHVFYLTVRRNSHSKWQGGHGGLQIEQIMTPDLVNWSEPMMVCPITAQWEAWKGTGDCIFADGLYQLFYPPQTIMPQSHPFSQKLATSVDGINFEEQEIRPPLKAMDSDLFRGPDGLWNLIAPGGVTEDGKAYLARWISDDLRKWERLEGPFVVAPETAKGFYCADWFEWNGWHYVLANQWLYKSRDPLGPWEEMMSPFSPKVVVPKTAAFHDNRRIAIGYSRDIPPNWGGYNIYRELVQDEQGNLFTKFPDELIPAAGPALDPDMTLLKGNGDYAGGRLELGGGSSQLHMAAFDEVPSDAVITMRVRPGSGEGRFGLGLRGRGDYEDGAELRFEPARDRVQFGRPNRGRLSPETSEEIEQVIGLDEPFKLTIVMQHDLIHVSINDARTFLQLHKEDGDRLFFFAEDTKVQFEEIEICPVAKNVAHQPMSQ